MVDLYNLGTIKWWETQCYYHALAYLGREGLILCSPSRPYVCLGFHDDLEQEIDQAFCRNNHLPLFRRETGGGVVLLDNRQVFYQVILRKNNPMIPLRRDLFFGNILQPVIAVFRSIGIDAELVLPADIKAGRLKCSGNGAGDIGDSVVYTGNMIVDFDFETMSRVLKVPSPVYRKCFRKAMQENMMALKGKVPGIDVSMLTVRLIEEFETFFGPLHEKFPDEEIKKMAACIRSRMTSQKWLHLPGRRNNFRRIKVTEGLFLQESERGFQLIRDGKIEEEISKTILFNSNV